MVIIQRGEIKKRVRQKEKWKERNETKGKIERK